MKLKVLDIQNVVQRQLCCGCGACAGLDPDGIEMIDSVDHGRRPRFRANADPAIRKPLPESLCPGVGLTKSSTPASHDVIPELKDGWGPVLELWEGFAGDDETRFAGSSGGAATALALWCIERGDMHGVLHIKSRKDAPLLNETVISHTRAELLGATGSRYSPASPCDLLHRVASAPSPCVMIGKPCDVAAACSAARVSWQLKTNLGATISIVCAGTPTTRATQRLVSTLGISNPSDVTDIRYRGNGWPGDTVVRYRIAAGEESRKLTYEQAWGDILARDKQWRCHVCADHTGEFADISVGDPWYRAPEPNEPGRSMVIIRTERGRRIVHAAMEAGYLTLKRVSADTLPRSQPNLLKARAAVWGRLLVCRLLGIPSPKYRGFPMFRFWLKVLTVNEKMRSLLGTIRRIRSRKLYMRVSITQDSPPASAMYESIDMKISDRAHAQSL